MDQILRLAVLAVMALQISASALYVKLHRAGDGEKSCTIISEETVKKFRGFTDNDENSIRVFTKDAISLPAYSGEGQPLDNSEIIEIYGRNQHSVDDYVASICKTRSPVAPIHSGSSRAPEILQIVNSGDKSNRIDVVFMGDGYTAEERDKFFDDIARLTKDMFEGDTFSSYLPVFNIWAIYVESVESGIGYNGPKDTPFRLYREAGQLRGIFPGNAAYARTVCALTGTSGCDYPSLIGNDDYYGGLGGEFVISTKSNRTGTVVLRHEMGHNFINVGEEYDDGSVYRGVNSASSLTNLGWTSWLTAPGPVREEKMIYRLLEYPWHDLSTGPRSFTFTSDDGTYDNGYLQVSVTAAGEEDSLEFVLDGQVLPWATRGSDDREFYDWFGDIGLKAGNHTLTVASKTTPTNPDIPRMIASITIHEYGNAEEFNAEWGHISAYPTWDTRRRKTYRPTNEGHCTTDQSGFHSCSMRNMTSSSFCAVCKEGMWMQFFQRISLIDLITVSPNGSPRLVLLDTPKLGQRRESGTGPPGEALEVSWYHDDVEQVVFKDQFSIFAVPGSWRVQVKFVTPEVRYDPTNLLTDSQTFTVPA